jgi:hypothetical protein
MDLKSTSKYMSLIFAEAYNENKVAVICGDVIRCYIITL